MGRQFFVNVSFEEKITAQPIGHQSNCSQIAKVASGVSSKFFPATYTKTVWVRKKSLAAEFY